MHIRMTCRPGVMSSRGLWAGPAWAELRAGRAARPVAFGWRIALRARAALPVGPQVSNGAITLSMAARAAGVDEAALETRARAPAVEARGRASTAEFHDWNATRRAAFVRQTNIRHRAVFSGLYLGAPRRVALDAKLTDTAACALWAAHWGHRRPYERRFA